MLRSILITVLIVAAIWAVASLFPSGCDTELCCVDCDSMAVERVIDGDTLVAKGGERVRFYGMDTPERGESCFDEATDRMAELAADLIKVEPGPRASDTFGRSLYYVYTDSGLSIDEILVEEGFARAWVRDGQHREYLIDLEANARDAKRGCLWSD